jgi:acyl-[acyl-carrier-protein]-phospholipid O-acyltransferase/long-chain-fatty-acid--[acyl-carrier-protein] ligase
VLFTTDRTLTRAQLQKAAREIGAQELAVARRIVQVRELPLLGSGKTDYVELSTRVMGEGGRRSMEPGK